jgi:hypothetical protein
VAIDLPHLFLGKRLDHLLLARHPPDPVVGLDAHPILPASGEHAGVPAA